MFWQPDYFDRYIRDQAHFDKVIRYIENNPVKAGLCRETGDWIYSSANTEMRQKMERGHSGSQPGEK